MDPFSAVCNSTLSSTYVSNGNIIYFLRKRAVRAVLIQTIEHILLLYFPN